MNKTEAPSTPLRYLLFSPFLLVVRDSLLAITIMQVARGKQRARRRQRAAHCFIQLVLLLPGISAIPDSPRVLRLFSLGPFTQQSPRRHLRSQ